MRRTISDVIRDRDLIELPADASVRAAARLMRDHAVGSVLITADGRLEGIFTERDLLCRVVAEGRDPDRTRLAEVMTAGPDTIAPDRPAIEGLRRMNDGGYRHLPVVAGGRVVGVVSRRDFYGDEQARIEEETKLWERI